MVSVCVVGLGYVGLPTALVLARAGNNVHGYDVDAGKVARIRSGVAGESEPGLQQLLSACLANQSLAVSTYPVSADYFIIAVPTPINAEKRADTSYVWAAVERIAQELKPGNTVIIESTVPVGLTDQVAVVLHEKTGLMVGRDLFVAHCPERVWPGKALHELVHNDRVIGGVTHACGQKAAQLYGTFARGDIEIKNAVFAELIKLVENSSIDVSVALAHQVAALAEHCGFDPYELIACANRHPRVNILNPTCGVGGHCVAVDPWFLIEQFPSITRLLQTARAVNDTRPTRVLTRIKRAVECEYGQRRCKILLLGVAYKPNVDDVRESPALKVAQALINDESMDVRVYDPHIDPARLGALLDAEPVDVHESIVWADVVIFLVAHAQFCQLDPHLLKSKKVLDFCGVSVTKTQQRSFMNTPECNDGCPAAIVPTTQPNGVAMGD